MSDSADIQQRDQQLADILAQVTELPADRRPQLQELISTHPHLADELRQLWGTIMVVDAVAEKTSDISPSPAPVSATIPPPSSLGDFQLGDEIGRGGMGIVYHAQQKSVGRNVALKLILQGTRASASDRARFRAEVSAAAQLDHPNIIPIYEVGDHQGWQYFGMKLIEGENLAAKIANHPLSETQSVELIKTVARAIQYAHERGVVHRDLKPANILLDQQGTPYVSDFGLAKQAESTISLTQSGIILGTPAYMSPEQAVGSRGEVSPQSDVYSLGVILYELLTGRPPFQAATPVDTMMLVLEQDALPPRLLNRRLSRDLEMIVLRCLQKPPELRYHSAGALADDLEAYQTGDPIAARSGHLGHIVARVFRDTHHVEVLENWGLLWMWHALVLLVMCVITNWMHIRRDIWPWMNTPGPYLILWGGGLAVWAPIFWLLRHRAGPVTTIERQIAHAWGGSIVAVILLFVVESLLALPVLTLSPVLGMISGMVFVVKAGILTGSFYIQAAALFTTSILMALLQHQGWPYGVTLYGFVSAATFFLPGWKYYRQSRSATG